MSDSSPTPSKVTRRRFIHSTAALAAVPLVTSAGTLRGQGFHAGSDTLKVGLIGCGGRGTGAAMQALRADKGAVLTAMGDVLKPKLDKSLTALTKAGKDQVQVSNDNLFLGFDAFEKVIASGVDVVILATPPTFRPVQLRAAIEAGKHVFCEKPVAVDGPGVRSVLETAALAKKKNLSLVCGFCWRYSTREREAFAKVHEGALGRVHTVYTTYNTSPLRIDKRKPGWSDMEWQIRNWYHFTWLSGDHLVEQAVHSIDKIAWAMNGELPEKAVAIGGRQARVEPERGNVWDHFGVTYEYKSGARGFHMCRQIQGCANDNSDLIIGDKGTCDINGWAKRHVITGENPWSCKAKSNNMYQQEHDELFAAIRSGKPMNDGVWMSHSVLMAIMGRMAAYTGRDVTWDMALNSKEKLGPTNLVWGDLPVGEIPIPGKTQLI